MIEFWEVATIGILGGFGLGLIVRLINFGINFVRKLFTI